MVLPLPRMYWLCSRMRCAYPGYGLAHGIHSRKTARREETVGLPVLSVYSVVKEILGLS